MLDTAKSGETPCKRLRLSEGGEDTSDRKQKSTGGGHEKDYGIVVWTGKSFTAPMPTLPGKRQPCGAHYRTTRFCKRGPNCPKVHRPIIKMSPSERSIWAKHVADTPNLEFTEEAERELMSYLNVNRESDE